MGGCSTGTILIALRVYIEHKQYLLCWAEGSHIETMAKWSSVAFGLMFWNIVTS